MLNQTNLWNPNVEAELFKKNSEASGKLLTNSDTGRSAEFYQNQIFQTLSDEEIQEHDRKKAEILNGDSYKNMRKFHRLDLNY